MTKKLHKRTYTSFKLINSINSRPEIKLYGGSQSKTKSQAQNHLIQSLSSSSIQIKQETKLRNFEKIIKT